MGVGPDQVVFAANGSLEVDDFASVTTTRSNTLVVNVASSGLGKSTTVGNHSTSTGVESVVSVALEDHTTVNGVVVTGGTLSQESSDTITGTVSQHATLTPLYPVQWTATPPPGGGTNVTIGTGVTRNLIPGTYNIVQVLSGGTLNLSPGSYFFEQLLTFPQSSVVVQHALQPVLVYVSSLLQWQGAAQDGGDPTHLFVGLSGNLLTPIQGTFRGTLVAPSASLQLLAAPSPHLGSFMGASVEAAVSAKVQFAAFAHWGLFVAPILSVTCVIQYNASSFGALFGYTNPLSTPFTIPSGTSNQFVPAVAGFSPLTTFAPGTHTGVIGVPLPGNAETWQVRNASVQATRSTLPACSGNETRIAQLVTPPPGVDLDRAGPASPEALSRLLPDVP